MPAQTRAKQLAAPPTPLAVIDAGRLSYDSGLTLQRDAVAAVLAARETRPMVGRLILVEHDPPVVTISRRPDARRHLVASPELLTKLGVEVRETDRGGDITYHGPGQLVAYPILDLNTLGLNLHAYLRFLEDIVIDLCRSLGVDAHRDVCATGVWVRGDPGRADTTCPGTSAGAKVCAMGVRVQRWITSHGLALNVNTNLDHFKLIVPCGLAGRRVASLAEQLGDACPTMEKIKYILADYFILRTQEFTEKRTAASDA